MATAIMKQKEVPEMDDVEEIISKISEDSPYKRRPAQKRTWMTVPEMGKLLGLKKTDRYWLVHKNVFESKEIAGKIRINIASFEKWYANQIKYHKVTGEEPGKELKSWSYSVKEVADLLGVDDYLVYELLKKNQMEAVIVDYWKRIPKESFQNWYKSQSRYRTKEDREKDALLEDATITMPEMAQLLGTTRSAVYTILDNPKYSHFFEFIVIAEKKRITKESFQKFLEGQDRYKLDPSNDYEELAQEQNIALANFRRKKLSQTGIRGINGNIKYLTFDEASYLAKVSRSMINKWADKGKFTVIKVGSRVRIRRDEFEDWMEQRDLERSMAYGNSCCRKGLKAYFIKATELNEKFTKARRTGTESSAISGLVRPSCLIIDEIGRSIFDMENTRLFFDMIDRRCSKEGPNCMIFTSNLTPDKWRDFFREEDSLLCALDRTFDAATVYLMKGESYRGRNLKTYSIEISDPVE